MPMLPAFCDTCGTVFGSGIVADNATNITFSGNRSGPCPKCGGMGRIPDGVFNFIGNTIEILRAPARTVAELTHLAEILREAQEKSQTKGEVSARIEKELPSLASLSKLLPENRAELYGFLAVVLAAVQLFTQSPQLPATNVTINTTQVISQVLAPQPAATAATNAKSGPKVGRNEPCPCGSGKKYKKCCGSIQ